MEWQFVVAIALAVPVILVPVALAWYLNVGGIYAAIKEAGKKRAEVTTEVIGEQATEKEFVGTRK